MKKYIINIAIFAVLMIALDIAVGYAATYLIDHAKSGATYKNKYICDRTTEDILIMGSSRGVHHYDPRIIEDSLGMTCYNCAYDGCGSITAYGLLSILTERYTPKIIVYDVHPGFDYLLTEKHNSQYLGALKYWYDRHGIDSLFIKVDPSEQWKMKFWMYRINSTSIQLLSEFLMHRNETVMGYMPRAHKMNYEPIIDESRKNLDFDPLKLECFQRIVKICNNRGIKLVLSVSPSYMKSDDYEFDLAKKIAKDNGIPFVSHFCDTNINTNKDYFYDSVHMNKIGATEFTNMFVSDLKSILE